METNKLPISEEERQSRIKELQSQKVALLDKYGIFGGGQLVNRMHEAINIQLEQLGVDPNS